MSRVATLGAMTFELERSAALRFPLVEEPLFTVDGLEVHRLAEGGTIYLVVDHRLEGTYDQPSRVEFWRASGAYEGPLAGLLLVSASRSIEPSAEPPGSLALFLASA